jgi:hypothetical protein
LEFGAGDRREFPKADLSQIFEDTDLFDCNVEAGLEFAYAGFGDNAFSGVAETRLDLFSGGRKDSSFKRFQHGSMDLTLKPEGQRQDRGR